MLLFAGCLTSQPHVSVSQGRICSDSCMHCHTETQVADQTFYLTQSWPTATGPASLSPDPKRAIQDSNQDLPLSRRMLCHKVPGRMKCDSPGGTGFKCTFLTFPHSQIILCPFDWQKALLGQKDRIKDTNIQILNPIPCFEKYSLKRFKLNVSKK